MKKEFIFGIKIHLMNLYGFLEDSLTHNASKSTFVMIMTALVNFFLKSFMVDVWLVFFLIAMNIMNTITGVMKAKRNGTDDDRILRESVTHKWIGYMILLISLSLFMGVLFILATKEGDLLVSEYWLNLPVALMLVFFNAMELKSTVNNSLDLGWKVPGFVRSLPDKVTDKIDKIGENIDLKP